jgi:hypothetical protein
MTAAEIGDALSDAITIIRARGRRLSKLISATGPVESYDAARTFNLAEVPIADLRSLERLLWKLLHRSDCAIVRGGIADPNRVRGVRRLLYPDPKTGNIPTLRDVPKRWVALDFDDLPRPNGIEATDLLAAARVAIATLPGTFHHATGLVQATASHGISPGSRLRLWYRLSRPTGGRELKLWLRHAPLDTSVFGAAQLIYTAAPQFTDGAVDPLPTRIALVPGSVDEVTVPIPAALDPERRTRPAVLGHPVAADVGRYTFVALRNATARVAQAPVGTRHATMLAEARGLTRFVAAGLLSVTDVRAALGGAAELSGKFRQEAEAVVSWALAHPSDAVLPESVRP